jgi:cytochrome P450
VKTSGFLALDPPDHGTLRRLVGNVFKPGWVRAMEPRVRELARARLDLAAARRIHSPHQRGFSSLPCTVVRR